MRKPRTLHEKTQAFRKLHERHGAFVIPNPWDVGTARLLMHLGFEALATTSAGYAFSAGKPDNSIKRDEMMEHVAAIASATDLPVSADLGNGFGDAPEVVAETISRAASAGLVGASIEDATTDAGNPIYAKAQAVERIRAAAETAHSLPFPFMLTARAENYLWERPDLEDTTDRLRAYQEAGADVLYAPGITSEADILSLVSALERPVNILAGITGLQLNVRQLSAIGVKRISVGSALSRAAIGAVLAAGREMREHGTFSFAEAAANFRETNALFAEPVQSPAAF